MIAPILTASAIAAIAMAGTGSATLRQSSDWPKVLQFYKVSFVNQDDKREISWARIAQIIAGIVLFALVFGFFGYPWVGVLLALVAVPYMVM